MSPEIKYSLSQSAVSQGTSDWICVRYTDSRARELFETHPVIIMNIYLLHNYMEN